MRRVSRVIGEAVPWGSPLVEGQDGKLAADPTLVGGAGVLVRPADAGDARACEPDTTQVVQTDGEILVEIPGGTAWVTVHNGRI